MSSQILKKQMNAGHSMLSTINSLKSQLNQAFQDRLVDKDFYIDMVKLMQGLDQTVRCEIMAREQEYSKIGGYYHNAKDGLKGAIRYGF